ncbi:MAG: bifunctional UDP-N-acetylglucosamine diphosphorylase/glucosamine-1-phosphate N-acetyltransferase GlmU [Synechococcales bacterium]|nr:bifunctional UDP-N-acetylglucosamine diphosphorylase/glucosamine-1-phosphate N-acetyltransferase GlmU [Synechococcales bacterium]
MVAVAILAAGKGTRMKSDLPKVLHRLGHQTLVERVLETTMTLQPDRQFVIVGYQGDRVREALSDRQVEFVEQREQLGTGHATQQLLPYLGVYEGDVLILNGDAPLMRPGTLQALLDIHHRHQNAATVLTAQLPNPKGYGRVFCDDRGYLTEIIEERDCTPNQRQNARVNSGTYCFRWQDLAQVLPKLTTQNAQQEYYLTDVIRLLDSVMAMDVDDYREVQGINDRRQLADAHTILQERIKTHWLMQGVTIVDPTSVTIDDTVILAPNVTIEPQTHLRGQTTIAAGSVIGPGSLVVDSQIGENVTVLYSVINQSTIQNGSIIGPFTHFRTNATVGENCRIGNFVELKNVQIGNSTNAAHLSYLGDAVLGEQVNIGAGTITVNYDGKFKHQTVIGDRTRIGSDNCLVAPIRIGTDVTTAAGSTIVEDVPDDCLVIARAKQVVKPGWRPQWQR